MKWQPSSDPLCQQKQQGNIPNAHPYLLLVLFLNTGNSVSEGTGWRFEKNASAISRGGGEAQQPLRCSEWACWSGLGNTSLNVHDRREKFCYLICSWKTQVQGSKSEAIKAAASSDAETKKLKAEVEELKGKLQLSAEEVTKLKSRCAALSDLADQVFATRHPMCMVDVNVSFYKYNYVNRQVHDSKHKRTCQISSDKALQGLLLIDKCNYWPC